MMIDRLYKFPTVVEIAKARRTLNALASAAEYGASGFLGSLVSYVDRRSFNDVAAALNSLESAIVTESSWPRA